MASARRQNPKWSMWLASQEVSIRKMASMQTSVATSQQRNQNTPYSSATRDQRHQLPEEAWQDNLSER